MRSFSNLWYWIALAVAWSTASHWVLGVPYDSVLRARRQGGQAAQDLEVVVRVNINRMTYIANASGLLLAALVPGVLVALAILAFWYWVEFAQALFLLALPLSIVGALSFRTARKIAEEGDFGPGLYRRLARHRLVTQVIGMISVFVTAIFGMAQNLSVGVI